MCPFSGGGEFGIVVRSCPRRRIEVRRNWIFDPFVPVMRLRTVGYCCKVSVIIILGDRMAHLDYIPFVLFFQRYPVRDSIQVATVAHRRNDPVALDHIPLVRIRSGIIVEVLVLSKAFLDEGLFDAKITCF